RTDAPATVTRRLRRIEDGCADMADWVLRRRIKGRESVVLFRKSRSPVKAHAQADVELLGQLDVVVDPGGRVLHFGHVLEWYRKIPVVSLAPHKCREFIPSRPVEVIPCCVVPGCLICREVEVPARVHSPTGLREGHVTVFESRLDRVFARNPGNVIEELVTVV